MAAKEVLEALRRGELIATETARSLSKFSVIDEARREVFAADVNTLITLTTNVNTAISCLAIDLLRPLVQVSEVKAHLRVLWAGELSRIERYHLLFRLLEIEDQGEDFHLKSWDWVRENIEWFLDQRKEWYGGKDRVIEGVCSRLMDPTFPLRKKWIYLASLLAVDDLAQARAIIGGYKTSPDPVLAEIAAKILEETNLIYAGDSRRP